MATDGFTYDAFISYRRSDGAAAAAALRRSLRSYRLPRVLAPGRRQPLSVYLDTVYERATEDFFAHTVLPALAGSRYLILVHTPATLMPRSDGKENWVCREVREFRKFPQGSNVCIVTPSGDMDGALPADLHIDFPNIQRISTRRRWRPYARLGDELLQIVATLHGIPAEEMPTLRLETERQRRRRMASRLSAACALIAALGVLTILLADALLTSRSLQYAAEAKNALPARMDLALTRAAEAQRVRDTTEARTALLAAFQASPRLRGILPTPDFPSAVAFSPSGDCVAVASDQGVTCWDTASLKPAAPRWSTGSRVEQLAFSPDGAVVIAMSGGALHGHDMRSHETFSVQTDMVHARALQFRESPPQLVAVMADGRVRGWPIDRLRDGPGHEIAALPAETSGHRSVLSADGRRIALFSPYSSDVRIGVLDAHPLVLTKPAFGGEVLRLALPDQGDLVATGPRVVYRLGPGAAALVAEDAAYRYESPVAVTPDGKLFVYVTEADNLIVVCSVEQGPLFRLPGHTHNVHSVCFGRRGEDVLLASIGDIRPRSGTQGPEQGLILWDLSNPHPLGDRVSPARVYSPVLALDRACSQLACMTGPQRIEVWPLAATKVAGKPLALTIPGPAERAELLRFSPDQRRLGAVLDSGVLAAWDLATGTCIQSERPAGAGVRDMVFDEGNRLVTLDADLQLTDWTVEAGTIRQVRSTPIPGERDAVVAALHPGGDVVAWSASGEFLVWNRGSTKIRRSHVPGDDGGLVAFSYSPDGEHACVAFDTGVALFDPTTAALRSAPVSPLRYEPSGLPTTIGRLAVSERFIVTASNSRDLTLLWDRASQRVLGQLPTGMVRREALAFSGDGSVLASVSEEVGLVLWDLRAETWGAIARQRVVLP